MPEVMSFVLTRRMCLVYSCYLFTFKIGSGKSQRTEITWQVMWQFPIWSFYMFNFCSEITLCVQAHRDMFSFSRCLRRCRCLRRLTTAQRLVCWERFVSLSLSRAKKLANRKDFALAGAILKANKARLLRRNLVIRRQQIKYDWG